MRTNETAMFFSFSQATDGPPRFSLEFLVLVIPAEVELDLEGAMAPEAFAAAADSSDEDDAAGAQAEE